MAAINCQTYLLATGTLSLEQKLKQNIAILIVKAIGSILQGENVLLSCNIFKTFLLLKLRAH